MVTVLLALSARQGVEATLEVSYELRLD
jgi:hypothetical protein